VEDIVGPKLFNLVIESSICAQVFHYL